MFVFGKLAFTSLSFDFQGKKKKSLTLNIFKRLKYINRLVTHYNHRNR